MRAVGNLTHRGAVSADAASGDGAGVTLQIPYELLPEDAFAFGLEECDLRRLAVAMVFLPPEEDSRWKARALLEEAAASTGIDVLGWRVVPTDSSGSTLARRLRRGTRCGDELVVDRAALPSVQLGECLQDVLVRGPNAVVDLDEFPTDLAVLVDHEDGGVRDRSLP